MKTTFKLAAVSLLAGCAVIASAQEQTTTVGGYGNAVYRFMTPHTIIGGKDSSGPTDAKASIDRFVLFVSHQFNDQISFKSELEVENTKVEPESSPLGEVAVEQMFLEFAVSKGFNPRVGLILVPVGIINETHEPPTFNGNSRPQLDNEDGGIIPTTWRDIGAGAWGQIADGWSYRAYVMASMLGSEFSHDGGIGEGKQEGQQSNLKNLALTGRLEYTGVAGLKAGASFYYGGTSAGDTAAFGGSIGSGIFSVPLSMIELDAQYSVGDLNLRGEWAMSSIDADNINKAYHTDSTGALVDPVAKGMGGFYLEAAYNVWKLIDKNSSAQLLPFVRYESINLNSSLASNTTQDDNLVKTAIDFGLTYKPAYNVALKFDVLNYTSKAFGNSVNGATSMNTVALGLGYMF